MYTYSPIRFIVDDEIPHELGLPRPTAETPRVKRHSSNIASPSCYSVADTIGADWRSTSTTGVSSQVLPPRVDSSPLGRDSHGSDEALHSSVTLKLQQGYVAPAVGRERDGSTTKVPVGERDSIGHGTLSRYIVSTVNVLTQSPYKNTERNYTNEHSEIC